MRARRPFVLAVAAGLAAATLARAPYASADSSVVYDGPTSLPHDGTVGLFTINCSEPYLTPAASAGPVLVTQGPGTAPLGSHSWGYETPVAANGEAAGFFRSVSSMNNLLTANGEFYYDGSAPQADGEALADVLEDPNTGMSWIGHADLSISPSTSWGNVSVSALVFSWTEVTSLLNPTGAPPVVGTIGTILSHIGSGDHPGYIGIGFGCNNPGPVYFDDLQIGDSGDVVTYDFEGTATTTTATAKPTVITAGRSTTLSGVMTRADSSTVASAPLTLEAKAYGATQWKVVAHAIETFDTSQHPALSTQKPLVATQFRWRYAGGSSDEPSTSKPVTVAVHTALTLSAPSTARHGGSFTVSGRTTPPKPGRVVTLWKGTKKIGSGTMKPDGTYAIKVRATSTGAWKLHATIGAASGNLAGRSATRTVTVH